MTPPDPDHWLPKPQIRVRHRQAARATPQELWAAAESVRLDETGRLGRLVRWRIPSVTADQTFYSVFAGHPFSILAEGPQWSVSGLCGPIWTFRDDYHAIASPEEYRSWERGGTARVLFVHWITQDGDGTSTLHSESRVKAVDLRARIALKPLGLVVRQFDRLIGTEPLSLAAKRAEAASAR